MNSNSNNIDNVSVQKKKVIYPHRGAQPLWEFHAATGIKTKWWLFLQFDSNVQFFPRRKMVNVSMACTMWPSEIKNEMVDALCSHCSPFLNLRQHKTMTDKPLKSLIVCVALPTALGFDCMLCCCSVFLFCHFGAVPRVQLCLAGFGWAQHDSVCCCFWHQRLWCMPSPGLSCIPCPEPHPPEGQEGMSSGGEREWSPQGWFWKQRKKQNKMVQFWCTFIHFFLLKPCNAGIKCVVGNNTLAMLHPSSLQVGHILFLMKER